MFIIVYAFAKILLWRSLGGNLPTCPKPQTQVVVNQITS